MSFYDFWLDKDPENQDRVSVPFIVTVVCVCGGGGGLAGLHIVRVLQPSCLNQSCIMTI